MGPFAYFSPGFLGFLLALVVGTSFRPIQPGASAASYWLQTAGAALVVGIVAQLALIGAQGAFAQVLPAPRGRSVRGKPAALAGAFLLLFVGVFSGSSVMYSGTFDAGTITGFVIAGALLLAALGVYGWALPAAVQDFAADD